MDNDLPNYIKIREWKNTKEQFALITSYTNYYMEL